MRNTRPKANRKSHVTWRRCEGGCRVGGGGGSAEGREEGEWRRENWCREKAWKEEVVIKDVVEGESEGAAEGGRRRRG